MAEYDLRPTDEQREEISRQLDPAPGPTDAIHDRVEQYVAGLTSAALDELRKFRDETDGLMAALQNHHRLLVSAITDHTGKVEAVLASKIIMAEQTQKLRELFAPVTPVLTQLNGGGQK